MVIIDVVSIWLYDKNPTSDTKYIHFSFIAHGTAINALYSITTLRHACCSLFIHSHTHKMMKNLIKINKIGQKFFLQSFQCWNWNKAIRLWMSFIACREMRFFFFVFFLLRLPLEKSFVLPFISNLLHMKCVHHYYSYLLYVKCREKYFLREFYEYSFPE